MKANAVALLLIFENKLRLEVPMFQRQYVWNRSQQWEPLWEDVARKFTEYLEGRKEAPVHFLGAMVLDQKQTPSTHVEKRQVIDGQQRLTTLQIFLAAFRDFCRENDCEELARECEIFTLNRGMMADPEVEKIQGLADDPRPRPVHGRRRLRFEGRAGEAPPSGPQEIRSEAGPAAAHGRGCSGPQL